MKIFVGITGASGSLYGIRIAQELLKKGDEVYLCISEAGKIVVKEELGLVSDNLIDEIIDKYFKSIRKPIFLKPDQLNSAPASGSSNFDIVFVAPCSVSTLSNIAYGTSRNLIHRAADVALKERKKLILLIRETPLSIVHIKAMLEAALAGAVILPASPAFYINPSTVDDLIDFIVGKALDVAGIDNNLYRRYRT